MPVKIGLTVLSLALILCAAIGLGSTSNQTQQPQSESLLEEGTKLIATRKYADAIAAFNPFKQAKPQDARPYFYSGLALAEAGRLSAAALELNEAVRLDPQRLEYLVMQASVFARLKQKPEAEDALMIFQKPETAERMEPSWIWLLSDVYYRLERFDDARRRSTTRWVRPTSVKASGKRQRSSWTDFRS